MKSFSCFMSGENSTNILDHPCLLVQSQTSLLLGSKLTSCGLEVWEQAHCQTESETGLRQACYTSTEISVRCSDSLMSVDSCLLMLSVSRLVVSAQASTGCLIRSMALSTLTTCFKDWAAWCGATWQGGLRTSQAGADWNTGSLYWASKAWKRLISLELPLSSVARLVSGRRLMSDGTSGSAYNSFAHWLLRQGVGASQGMQDRTGSSGWMIECLLVTLLQSVSVTVADSELVVWSMSLTINIKQGYSVTATEH